MSNLPAWYNTTARKCVLQVKTSATKEKVSPYRQIKAWFYKLREQKWKWSIFTKFCLFKPVFYLQFVVVIKTHALTLSVPEKLKNSIFEMPIIPQIFNINNLRPTSAKSINLDTIRKLTEYFLKNVREKAYLNVYSYRFRDIVVQR